MSGWKGGGLLLVLAIPLAFYAAWQVKGVVRADMVVSDAPPDRGGTKEQLAATKAKTAAWAGDARKASSVALQYRQPGAGDTAADASAAAVIKTSADRSADLTDLDLFLAGVENPKFIGRLKDDYARWKLDADKAHADGRAVVDWLRKPVTATSAAEAARWMNELDALIAQYRSRSTFASPKQAALWRLSGRLALIKELGAQADAQYPTAAGVPLPLKAGNDAMKTALATFAAVTTQVALLEGDLKAAIEEKADIPGEMQSEINERRATAGQCQRRERLLKLFAQENLFTNAGGAQVWLKEIASVYRESKSEEDKKHIRKKVHEFCEAFLPPTARLDDEVLLGTKPAKRAAVQIKYKENGVTKRDPLSSNPNGLTEFNAATTHPGETTFVLYAGGEEYLKDLKPTAVSRAAVFYNAERKAVAAPGTGGPKWTVKTVEDLKNKCEAQKELVDKLDKLKKLPGEGEKPSDEELKILVRIEGLLEGLKECTNLLEVAP